MEVLKKNYFDPKHPIAFAGVEKIYRWFKENGYKLSRTKIKNWLLKQEDYAIHQQPRRQFQRRRVISPYPGYMIDADLADYIHTGKVTMVLNSCCCVLTCFLVMYGPKL